MRILSELSNDEVNALLYDWKFWARPAQLEPASRDWSVWLVLAGRGFGKTRTGAEWVREKVESGNYNRLALVGETAADVRDVMIEGESGILSISPPWNKPIYKASLRRVEWPNGAIATTYSGVEPDQLRGPQHDAAWVDELAKFRYPQETWDNLELGLRLGNHPVCLATTTPKNIKIVKELILDEQTIVTSGSSYDNISNLPQKFIQRIIKKYEGTRLGEQELYAKILEDNPNALWSRELLDKYRVFKAPELVRIAVAIDPSTTSEATSAETGIVIAGVDSAGQGYVIDDSSLRAKPNDWAMKAIAGYYKMNADIIVGEANNGGDMIETIIRNIDPNIPYKKVHASRGKYTRAEPVSMLYEQGKVHHVGSYSDLEDQMCNWIPGEKSPDRLDALVWALTELMLTGKQPVKIRSKSVGNKKARGRR